MKNFNVLNPTELYEYFDKILQTTKEFCLDEEGLEFEGKRYYTPLIFINSLDIVLTNFDYNSHRARYSIKLYYREPYEDCTNNLVFQFSLEHSELNNLDIITEKFKAACRKYLLDKEREDIQDRINYISKKLSKKDIDKILNKDYNSITFNFETNELQLI